MPTSPAVSATAPPSSLSLHAALPISGFSRFYPVGEGLFEFADASEAVAAIQAINADYPRDRKSTRLNSSHPSISYAVFCLKKQRQRPRAVPRVGVRGTHGTRTAWHES